MVGNICDVETQGKLDWCGRDRHETIHVNGMYNSQRSDTAEMKAADKEAGYEEQSQ